MRKYLLSGTKSIVARRSASKPIELTYRVFVTSRSTGLPLWEISNVLEMPTPRRMLSIGPPKQAENPMIGAKTATAMFATRSAREFPTAKIVRPMMASDKPKIKPKV